MFPTVRPVGVRVALEGEVVPVVGAVQKPVAEGEPQVPENN